MRVVAVDWTGRARPPDQRRHLWRADVVDGEIELLRRGRTREELVAELVSEAERDSDLVVGLDFAFSLPAWYLEQLEMTPAGLWARLADEALTETMARVGLPAWIEDPEGPFWRKAGAKPEGKPEYRRTEDEARAQGARAQSAFKLVGAGQVGRGSLYGMQALHRLSLAGFAVWPFTAARPLVVEIYPRLLTGPVTKSSPADRLAYLQRLELDVGLREQAAGSEDAFDALVSAIAMDRHRDELLTLTAEPAYATEGKIWAPAVRSDPVAELARRYVETWNERDPGRRLAALRDVVCPDVVYVDPITDPVSGPEGLSRLVGDTQARMPRFRLELAGPCAEHHGRLRFGWVLRLESGEIDNAGVDFVELDADGRMRSIVGFFDPAG